MRLLVSFTLILLSISTYAQKNKYLHTIDFSKFEFSPQSIDSNLSNKVEDSAVVAIDIKAEYWDNKVYNPYKDAEVEFPLQLQFKDTSYASPIGKNKVITSRYGWRHGRAHKGIDIDLVTGDSVYSMFDGIVRLARYNTGHGRTVVVRHFNGLETTYAHLSKYGVKENDTVAKGAYLGKGGVSGNARGSHLHLVINYKGISINPEYLFAFNNDNTIRSKEVWVTKKWTRPYAHSSKRQSKINLLRSEEDVLASLQKQTKIYVVKRGDTLSRISARNNVSIASLCKANAIHRNALIRVGQKLVIEN
ncbi:peptidoglycan DD-metalloendopeptidase family protein [Lacinutrix iliipiscaria]|uniref:Peptidoglycan DD-metalloendopeptidase family protein n=1 Tax=Lacinutrix iliipiscaria TaxID=1230532 RepID=A0ABW5WQM5_9FLAO